MFLVLHAWWSPAERWLGNVTLGTDLNCFLFFSFLFISHWIQLVLSTCSWAAYQWPYLQGLTTLSLLVPISCQEFLSLWRSLTDSSSSHVGIRGWLVSSRICASNYSCDFMSTVAMPCPEGSIAWHSFPSSFLYITSSLSSVMFSDPCS